MWRLSEGGGAGDGVARGGARPRAWFHRPGSFKNMHKNSVSITVPT